MKKPDFTETFREEKKFKATGMSFNKIVVSRKTFIIASFLLIALLVLSLAGLLWSYTASAEEEAETITYSCRQEAVLNYRVYTVPNELFTERSLGPGRAYLTALTDYIAIDFKYNIFGESEAEINGEYDVTASLVAMTTGQEHLVWEKNEKLISTQKFKATGTDFSFIEQVDIPLTEYLAFAERVREETGYNPSELNLTVIFSVRMEAKTADGSVTEELSPTMIIPLKGNLFTVDGNLLEERESIITETNTVASSMMNNTFQVFLILVPASAVGIVLLRLLTVPSKKKARRRGSAVPAILKKHKDRIVMTANGVTSVPREAITVQSFDELLKLADEVGRPILYPQPKTSTDSEHIFLIYTPEQVYACKFNTGRDTEK